MAVRNLQFVLSGQDKSASSTFDKVGKKAAGMSGEFKKAEKAGGGLSGAIGKAAGSLPFVGGAIAVAAAGVFKLGGSFIETSSRLEALEAKSKTVFKDSLPLVKKWAKASAGSMKLTTSEALGLATNMADLLVPMGFTTDAAAKMSTKTVGLAGALSKWSGGTISSAEAADKLTDAMLGETDGLKALGIAISAADVEAQLLKTGQDKLEGAARKQAEAQAIQTLVFEKSTDAQAGFRSGTKTLADRMENLRVKMREAWEQLVVKLTPAMEKFADWIATKGAQKLADLIVWFEKNRDAIIAFGQAALNTFGDVLRGLADFVAITSQQFALFLDRASSVAQAFGNFGLAKSLREAAGNMAVAGVKAATALDAGATAADALATKLGGLKDKTVTVTVQTLYADRVAKNSHKSDAYETYSGNAMPAAGVSGGRRNVAAGNLTANVVLDGKVVASSTTAVQRAKTRNGAVPAFAP